MGKNSKNFCCDEHQMQLALRCLFVCLLRCCDKSLRERPMHHAVQIYAHC